LVKGLRCEITASSEPPSRGRGLLAGRGLLLDLEVSVVEVDGRHERVAGVDHAGDAASEN